MPSATSLSILLKYYVQKVRYNSLVLNILGGLSMLGIVIQPFYIFREGLSSIKPFQGMEETTYRVSPLSRQDMENISKFPDRKVGIADLLKRIEKNNLGLGLFHRDNLVAFTWCNLDYCTYPGCRFHLDSYEAYLFDAYTVEEYRGKGLGPQIRCHLYVELEKMGRVRLYSISECFNRSAVRFKQKLAGRILARGTYIELYRRWRFTTGLAKTPFLENRKTIYVDPNDY